MSFDVLAPHYRWMEFVLAGEKLQRCRTSFLDEISPPAEVLLVGEGRGRFLTECCARWPETRVTYVDASCRMLDLTRRETIRQKLDNRIDFVHADILQWTPEPGSFDLIATHFFFDCFQPDQIQAIVDKLSIAAQSPACWLLSDFQVPRSGIWRLRADWIVRLMYAFFRVATRLPARRLTPPDEFLGACGFRLQARQVSEWGLLRSDHWGREEGLKSQTRMRCLNGARVA